ncbi:hypothetical protein CC78DRAFT_86710 [Lojkania enalia]|uniref:Cleavage/polyadenylation specificity factor A subunit N-terminal domain-containing protein n=1 Tax=Lojkania enalia TaxID=147567 RepID=A0A9P4MZ01_9PLEO|nr:hypothetical protein CC78DRAFT_86710 [Didymosphaeria enalia]
MAHQIQQQVLVDGEWVSRPVDVYQLMARAQQQTDARTRESVADQDPEFEIPLVGILSKTVFDSPFVQFILPANIRHKNQNDVVFVGEYSVHLKEVCAYGHLRHVATKADFKGRILAAGVFGETRKAEANTEHGTLFKRTAVHAKRRSTMDDEADALPPKVVVLTLDTRTLMFLWAESNRTGNTRFRQKTIRLPSGNSRYERLGSHLAVDPKCRAIAVAAHEGGFMLYKTKSIDKWREEVRSGGDAVPVEDERFIPAEGCIMHMEFLSPGLDKADDHHVILMFILAHRGKTKMTCFDWDTRHDLSTATVRAERVSVDLDDQVPSLLIPLYRSPDFLLVCDRHISLYRSILSGVPTRIPCPIDNVVAPALRPGEAKTYPRWVQWDRVSRHSTFAKEAFYLVREDGGLLYAELGDAKKIETSHVGEWPHPIDKGFASLSVDISELALSNPDVLIAAGTTSDGQVTKVGSWITEYQYQAAYSTLLSPSPIESIPNWAPVADLAVTRLPEFHTEHGRERDSILVANGRGSHGAISELRKGFHALVDGDAGGMEGCTGLWIIDYGTEERAMDGSMERENFTIFLITIPPETMVLRASRIEAGENSSWQMMQIHQSDELVHDGLILDEETVSACCLLDRYVVQITRKEARSILRSDMSVVDSHSFDSTFLLVGATSSQIPVIATVARDHAHIALQVVEVLESGAFGKDARYELASDPTCLELLAIEGVPYIFVGLMDGSLLVFTIREAKLSLVYKENLGGVSTNGLRMVFESVVCLSFEESSTIVCGMRNGVLLNLRVDVSHAGFKVLSKYTTRMGTTAVQLTRSATDMSVAFAACGTDLCRICHPRNESAVLAIDSIWFTKATEPGYQQASVTAIDQIPNTKSASKDLSGFIFAVSGSRLLISQLDYDIRWASHNIPLSNMAHSKTVPRKLTTNATPTKVVYLEGLRKMAVATTATHEERAPPNGYRSVRSRIQLLQLDDEEQEIKQEEGEVSRNKLIASNFSLKNYERVYSIAEWKISTPSGRAYHFIIVGTGIMQGPGRETGRRLMLQLQGSDGSVKLMKHHNYEHPVRSIALYGAKGLAMIVGKTLIMEEYDAKNLKWQNRGSKELPSPGVHMTVSKPYIYVSTVQCSHVCYKFSRPSDEDQFAIERFFTDDRQRELTWHINWRLGDMIPASVPDSPDSVTGKSKGPLPPKMPANIVLLADKSGNVAGLFHPDTDDIKAVAGKTLFEACLPRSVIRLRNGSIRPPWRRVSHGISGDPDDFNLVTGIINDDTIGVCSDGTVYSFTILTPPTLKMLRFIQNLIEIKQNRDPEFQYSIIRHENARPDPDMMDEGDGLIKAWDVDPSVREKEHAAPRMRHVDGDVLMRFFNQEQARLKTLVTENTEQRVDDLFKELAEGVLAEEGSLYGGEGVYNRIAEWMGEVLMPLL